jgi:hypothetical protein
MTRKEYYKLFDDYLQDDRVSDYHKLNLHLAMVEGYTEMVKYLIKLEYLYNNNGFRDMIETAEMMEAL